jgi:hypothetical protein
VAHCFPPNRPASNTSSSSTLGRIVIIFIQKSAAYKRTYVPTNPTGLTSEELYWLGCEWLAAKPNRIVGSLRHSGRIRSSGSRNILIGAPRIQPGVERALLFLTLRHR